jgi:hypothetical protein
VSGSFGPTTAPRYNACVITRGIREWAGRDWDVARASKDTYWGERIARLGPVEGLRIAEELRRQVLTQDATWPSAADRHQDLLSHVRLAELFRRAGTARRR